MLITLMASLLLFLSFSEDKHDSVSEASLFLSLLRSLSAFSNMATAKNTVIWPNFLMWKFWGKEQFPHSFTRIPRNYAGTVPSTKFPSQKISKIMEFFWSGQLSLNYLTPDIWHHHCINGRGAKGKVCFGKR